MLLYSNRAYWRIVLQVKGSIVFSFRNVLAGLVVALVTFILSYIKRDQGSLLAKVVPSNNVGWNMMGGTIVFAVVFRTNLGWQRYWEALTQLQLMYSKWGDAFTQAVGFVNVTIVQLQQDDKDDPEEEITFLQDKLGSLQRNFSLLSALSAHRLTHGDVHRMEQRCKVAPWKDQVILRRDLRIGEDLTGATQLPEFVKVTDRSQLNENLDNSWFGAYCVTDVPSREEEELLTDTTDRVHAVMYWIFHDLSEISQKLKIPPPIQSRMYQELSNGMLGLQNAIKIADVPFPFQFTQLFNVLVIAFTIFIPVYASVFTESMILSPLIAYVVHQSILVINQVAMQLETPFGTGYNDISVKDFHARFLETIIEINPVCKYKCGESKRLLDAQAALVSRKSQAARVTVSRPSVVESLGMKARPTFGPSPDTQNSNSKLSVQRNTINGRRPSFSNFFGAFAGSPSRDDRPTDPAVDVPSTDAAVAELEASIRALREDCQKREYYQKRATIADKEDTDSQDSSPEEAGRANKETAPEKGEEVSTMNQPHEFRVRLIPSRIQEAQDCENQSEGAAEDDFRDVLPQPSLPGHQGLENDEALATSRHSSDYLS